MPPRLPCLLLVLFTFFPLFSVGIAEDDPPLLPLLAREPGLRRLIDLMERAFSDQFRPPCRSKVNNTFHRGLNAPTEELRLCLEEAMLRPTATMRSFRAFTTAALTYTPPGYGAKKARNLGGTYPYLGGGLFRELGDARQETYTNHRWYRSGGQFSFAKPSEILNRSLVYWNLNRFYGKDLELLRDWLRTGKVTNHFFVVGHNQDRPGYPRWLLDHPLVLKVFGHHVPAEKRHPKLIPIPLGLAKPKEIPTVLHSTRLKAAGRPEKYAPTRLLMARFNENLGPLRPKVAQAIRRNFRLNSTEKIGKQQFYFDSLRYKFMVSPPGVGFESSKAVEAHYLGRVPLIPDLFRNDSHVGLPFLTVSDWDGLLPEHLERHWDALMADPTPRYNLDKLWARWWLAFILRECLLTP